MEITRKRKLDTNTDGNLDLLSNLPRHIIDCILNRLPIHDAVRTSVLSRKWTGYLATLQHLDFGYPFYRAIRNAAEKKGYYYKDHELKFEYENIITKILCLHQGPLFKVTLYIRKFDSGICRIPDTNLWIRLLSRNNIKELILHYDELEPHSLPRCFFSCLEYLTHLELRNLIFLPPPDFNGFRNLIALELVKVKFKDNMFESFLCGSPLLQKLILDNCSGIDPFKVSVPNLERFELYAKRTRETICFENVPKLVDVTIATRVISVDHFARSCPLLEFLASLPKVTRLSTNGEFLEFLAGDNLPLELPTTLEGLTYLILDGLDFANFDEISCAVCLIRNAPNLKQLEILACTSSRAITKWGYMAAESPFGCTLDRLRVLKIGCIAGFKPELELVQFLLVNSPFLEKIYIEPDYSLRENKVALDMIMELIGCYRTSPRVDIILLDT